MHTDLSVILARNAALAVWHGGKLEVVLLGRLLLAIPESTREYGFDMQMYTMRCNTRKPPQSLVPASIKLCCGL
jgi:hypothetical protein